jgi:hypothetical protein
LCIELAVATGIAPSVWAQEGEAAIATAVEILNKRNTSE